MIEIPKFSWSAPKRPCLPHQNVQKQKNDEKQRASYIPTTAFLPTVCHRFLHLLCFDKMSLFITWRSLYVLLISFLHRFFLCISVFVCCIRYPIVQYIFLIFGSSGKKYLFGASSLSPSVSLDGLRAASVLPDSRAIDRLLAWRTISFLAGGRGRRGLASWIKVWHWSRSLAAVTLAYDININ